MTLVLDLRTLRDHPWVARRVMDGLTAAASVMLERKHGRRAEDPALVRRRDERLDAVIVRTPIEPNEREWLADPKRTASGTLPHRAGSRFDCSDAAVAIDLLSATDARGPD